MKKKLIGLFGIVVSGIALASCGGQADEKLSTSKEFDIEAPEVETDAKKLTKDEFLELQKEFLKDDESQTYDELEEYYKDYNSIVFVSKNYEKYNDFEATNYSKLIFDFKKGNYWCYEKLIYSTDENTYVSDYETKVKGYPDKAIVRTSINLNHYQYRNGSIEDEDGFVSITFGNLTGKADIYTEITSESNLTYFNFLMDSCYSNFYRMSVNPISASVSIMFNDESFEFYTKDNYYYATRTTVYEGSKATQVEITKNQFKGDYYTKYENDVPVRESYFEQYLIQNELLDDTMNLDGYTMYSCLDKYINSDFALPFFSYNGPLRYADLIVNEIPEDIFAANFKEEE